VTNLTLRLGHHVPMDFVSFDVSPAEALAMETKFEFRLCPAHITGNGKDWSTNR